MFDSATAYYAAGAGLGHLRRMTKVIAALELKQPLTILSNSRFLSEQAFTSKEYQDIYQHFSSDNIVHMPSERKDNGEGFLTWFEDIIEKRNIKHLIVDTFPVGIKGELNGLSQFCKGINIVLVARLLKWGEYKKLIQRDNTFSNCYYIEPLGVEYEGYLRSFADRFTWLDLPTTIENIDKPLFTFELPEHYCVVVHTGCSSEIEALLRYTRSRLKMLHKNLPIVLVSPDANEHKSSAFEVIPLNIYPALSVLLKAELVVSAAGFNTLHELKGCCKQHWVVPFERRYDDQFERAKRHKDA